MRKDVFVKVLESIGMSEADMWNFHTKYEEVDASEHRAFLKFLELSDAEIESVVEKVSK